MKLEEGAQLVAELKERLQQYEEDIEKRDSVSLCKQILLDIIISGIV